MARAAGREVKVLALTDHDDVAGLAEAAQAAAQHGIEFINGVEISVSWRKHTLHIVGLHIDPENPALAEGLRGIRSGRRHRAELMAESLARMRYRRRAGRCFTLCLQSGHDRAHPFCALSGRSRALQGCAQRVQPLSGQGQAGLCSAYMGGLAGCDLVDTAAAAVSPCWRIPGAIPPDAMPMGKTTLLELLKEFVEAGRAGHRSGERQPYAAAICRVRALCQGIRSVVFLRLGFSRAGRKLPRSWTIAGFSAGVPSGVDALGRDGSLIYGAILFHSSRTIRSRA